ncbi:MAG: hypothetical protein JRJ06_08225 [Deltaproteobacteria bacterium]|nr:hypothetical protein [Deltaproteobacteria bacterium]
MITNKRSINDTKEICSKLRASFDVPVSLLISPTILKDDDLKDFKAAGADKIGVAIDLATAELFDKYRGKGVGGPHKWTQYWDCLEKSISIFGAGNAGPHFMVGMGESEAEMSNAIQKSRDLGGRTHLFSFFPEANSQMGEHPVSPMEQYRRVQIARYIIDKQISRVDRFNFNEAGQIEDFGIPKERLDEVIDSGQPFRTSGCEGYDGEVACNRPFANSRPGPDMRNYPFPPNEKDVLYIREQLS